MGKGFNNYMTKKFFHPSSKDNIKRKWMAEQKTAFEKKAQEDLLAQYQKEQEVLSNRALLGDEKAKVGLSFMYDPPPGLKKKEEAESKQEVKFEWQRKYNAPREAYAKDDDTIRDQPFGIEVRNVRCIKCRQWGHVNTDKICPLFSRNLTAEPEMPESSSNSIIESLQADGLAIKNSVLGRMMGAEPDKHRQILADEDEEDPEVKFLQSLTPKQKKKLLKKLNKLQSEPKKKKKKSKKRKSNSDSSSEDSSDAEDVPKKKKSKRRYSSEDSDEDQKSRSHKHGKHLDKDDHHKKKGKKHEHRDKDEHRGGHRDDYRDRGNDYDNRDRGGNHKRRERDHEDRDRNYDRRDRSDERREKKHRSKHDRD